MFLALKEMKDTKLKYLLLTGIVFLIALVVFFLAGLASGLSDGHKKAISDWNATGMVLNENANKIVNASSLTVSDVTRVTGDKTAGVGFYSGALKKNSKDDTKDNVSVFGTNADSFVTPQVIKGKLFQNDKEIIISEDLAKEKNLKLNDTVTIGNLEDKLTIVGIIKKTSYSVEPVVYTNLNTYSLLKYGEIPEDTNAIAINLVAVKNKKYEDILITQNKQQPLEKMTSDTFINNLPGYTAEKLTLNMMVYVLILITASVVGIFMYVITLQKKKLFGILKAQGVPTKTIMGSIIFQSLFVAILGTVLAFVITYGLSLVMPGAMPFTFNGPTWSIYGIIIIITTTLGGLFSLPSILKVDPLIAIGG